MDCRSYCLRDVFFDRRRVGWLGAYVVVTFLSFPHPVGGVVLDLGWLIAWFGPACLLIGLRGLSPRAALGHTFLAVWLAHSLILHWFYVVTVTYGHAPAAVGIVAPIGGALYAAAMTCWFGFGWAWLQARGCSSPFVAASLWVALEHLRGFLFTGFPWLQVGYSQIGAPLSGLAPIVGVLGVGWALALTSGCIVYLVRRPGRWLLLVGAMVVFWLGAWWVGTIEWSRPAGAPIRGGGNPPENKFGLSPSYRHPHSP